MAFEFKPPARKRPSEYGGSAARALMEEISDFAKQHRRHGLRRFAGMDGDEPEQPMGPPDTAEGEMGMAEKCEACEAGTCDDPEHMSEEEAGKLVILLGTKDGGKQNPLGE